jgi:hypothetical protein
MSVSIPSCIRSFPTFFGMDVKGIGESMSLNPFLHQVISYTKSSGSVKVELRKVLNPFLHQVISYDWELTDYIIDGEPP